MKNAKGKVVVITGAAMGMGRLTALKFADEGASVVLIDIKKADLDKVAEEITARGGKAKGYLCDLMKRDMIYKTFETIERENGSVDVLFNNAGIVFGGPLLETDDDKLEATIQINLTAHLWTMKAVLPGMMRKREGHIINFASAAGMIGVPLLSAYCASKSGVIGMTEAVRAEMMDKGFPNIKFTIITPSYVSTGMFEGVKPPMLSPWVDPQVMVEKIYRAYQRDKLFVRAPTVVHTIPAMKALLPIGAMDVVAKALKMNHSMDKWTGRTKG